MSDHCPHGNDIRNKCDECDRIAVLESDVYVARRRLRTAETRAILALMKMDPERPFDIMVELAKIRSDILTRRTDLAATRAIVTAERAKADPPWKPLKCGRCSSCQIEQHGCACDGALDYGCFNCTEGQRRPECPRCINCGQHIYLPDAPHSALLHIEGDAFYCDVAKIFPSTPKPKCHICGSETEHHDMFCSAGGVALHYATAKPAA